MKYSEVKCWSDVCRCLFSWLSSWSGTCVRCCSSTQLQVQTSAMSSFRFDLSFSALHDWVLLSRCSRISAAPPAGLGAPAQVRRGHQSERGVTERQPHPTSVLLGRGMKRETSDLQILHASPLASSCICVSVQVISLVLQGRMDEARQVLSKQASLRAESSSVFRRMDVLLQTMPIFNVRTSGHNIPMIKGLNYNLFLWDLPLIIIKSL